MREIERRIQRTEAGNAASVTSVAAPVGIPEAFEEHAAQMFDLLAVAFQADLTRVFTYMMAREASMRTFPVLGISEAHHDVSHHGNAAAKMQQHAKITTHFMALFAKFVEKLKAAPEGDGSVLDHSLIAFGTGMSDGQAHNAYPLPFTLVGGAGGRLKGNRFIVAPEWTSIANVWLSVADMFGTPLEKFGESTGRFSCNGRSEGRSHGPVLGGTPHSAWMQSSPCSQCLARGPCPVLRRDALLSLRPLLLHRADRRRREGGQSRRGPIPHQAESRRQRG